MMPNVFQNIICQIKSTPKFRLSTEGHSFLLVNYRFA